MCYTVPCNSCGRTTWGGCGQHVKSVYDRLTEAQRCNCKPWPGCAPQGSSKDWVSGYVETLGTCLFPHTSTSGVAPVHAAVNAF
ncbi:hypothetical protein CBR_g28808 [Chara braunii]|uniref:Uncharacterized protein n=1 Tax=Chara braunii TaxID=69332 RepID=A0A388LA38_CHABU|nr:hypothetical protein CBR_g28808 [Chara braunii]|eukprot:GBG79092.1 hypothetical protein CBR_g28808 [Chara braunii]